MTAWGPGPYGPGAWGVDKILPGLHAPQVIERAPAPNVVQVPRRPVFRVTFYDVDNDFDPTMTTLTVNGTPVYSGGAYAGAVGSVTLGLGTATYQFVMNTLFDYDQLVQVTAYGQDTLALPCQDSWSFRIVGDTYCYAGTSPTDPELWVQQPMQQFLDLEDARKTLLDVALVPSDKAVPNRTNRAARVLYQAAYDTEISTVLNRYFLPNKAALATPVCERARVVDIDAALAPYKDRTLQGAQLLFKAGVITETYLSSFNDYLDSLSYVYRVGAMCNLVFLARAVETQ